MREGERGRKIVKEIEKLTKSLMKRQKISKGKIKVDNRCEKKKKMEKFEKKTLILNESLLLLPFSYFSSTLLLLLILHGRKTIFDEIMLIL